MKIPKARIDVLLTERGLAESREKAKAMIMAGEVFIKDKMIDKAGTAVPLDSEIEIRSKSHKFASRGGYKIEKALDYFSIDPQGQAVADIGASTGGFTDCVLGRGARKVYAVDVGRGQLAYKLASDPRVVVMDRTNARFLEPEMFDESPELISMDVSFISVRLILPALAKIMHPDGQIITLIKPQFEAGIDKVGKGGVVRDASVHREVITEVVSSASAIGLNLKGLTFSPIKGPAGNIEFLALFDKAAKTFADDEIAILIRETVSEAHEKAV